MMAVNSGNESAHFSSCRLVQPDSPTVRSYRRLISHSEGCASDPPIVTHGHSFQIPNLYLKHMSTRFSIATPQIPDPLGIVSGLQTHSAQMHLTGVCHSFKYFTFTAPRNHQLRNTCLLLVISGNPKLGKPSGCTKVCA